MQRRSSVIVGKTGSCIADKTWVGLFASVAPIENPRFAVVVITKGQYARGKYSAAIAGKVYQALKPHLKQKFNSTIAQKTVLVKSVPNIINVKTSAKTTDVEKSEINVKSEMLIAETDDNKTIENADKPNNTNNNVPITKELFPTIVINGKAEITRPRVVQNR